MATIEEFPKASKVTIRKVGGGFILEYEVPAKLSMGEHQQRALMAAQMAMSEEYRCPMQTVEHVVHDQSSLGAALARLLRE